MSRFQVGYGDVEKSSQLDVAHLYWHISLIDDTMMLFKRSLLLLALTTVSVCSKTSLTQSFSPRSSLIIEKPISDLTQVRGGGINEADKKAIAGAAGFILMDSAVRRVFKANGITFPSQLAGCIMLLSTMLITNVIKPGVGDFVFDALTPGANLLAKWYVSSFRFSLCVLYVPFHRFGLDLLTS